MLSLVLAWIMLCFVFVGGFLDLDELKNVYYGIDISDTPLLHPSVCQHRNRCGLCFVGYLLICWVIITQRSCAGNQRFRNWIL